MKYLHTMVRVKDLDVSLRFYRDALGLEEVRRSEHEQAASPWSIWPRRATTMRSWD